MTFILKRLIVFIWVVLGSLNLMAQTPKNWYLLDYAKDGFPGVAADKTYDELLKGKRADTVIVAIIDSGMEVEHDGLKPRMWVNKREIPNNGKDDDKNGYVDDIHGWNFIGGADGNNVGPDTYEVTRLYAKYRSKFKDVDPATLSKKEKKEYDLYQQYKTEVEKERSDSKRMLDRIMASMSMVTGAMVQLEDHLKDSDVFDKETVDGINPDGNQGLLMGKMIASQFLDAGMTFESFKSFKDIVMDQFSEQLNYYKNKAEVGYNPDFDTRSIVGDNYDDATERIYGNNDVEGPDAQHGTHVGGIVGAKAHQGDDIYGVARHVYLMSVRAVPDGDERDKDVANAIRYAVDNGASIINMSFGKGQSWNKKVVDDAVKYAAKKDVLLVHAAGNSAQNNDVTGNFPNPNYEKRRLFGPKRAPNWIEVGALSPSMDENLAAPFSNYGKKTVDVFAPGVEIYSTVPGNTYAYLQGTSMASPTVAGVAAILRSHFPELTAVQVRSIILASATPVKQKVLKPGSKDEMVSFTELCATGGYVNAYEAVKLAQQTKGKKKIKSGKSGKNSNASAPRT